MVMNRTKAFLIPILFILVLLGIYIFVFNFPMFNLAQIDIRGDHKISEKEILGKSGIRLGTNIFRMDLASIHQFIRKDKRIKDVWVKRILPNKMLIEVEEKKPALWINLPGGLYGLSEDQEIIPLEKEDFEHDLPIVTGFTSSSLLDKQNPKPYERWANMKVKLALDFYKALLEVDSSIMKNISEISLSEEDDLVLWLIPFGTQVNMGKGEFKKKLKRIQAVLYYEKEPEYLVGLDLRFKDRVVVKKSSPDSTDSSSQDPNFRSPPMRQRDLGKKKNL